MGLVPGIKHFSSRL